MDEHIPVLAETLAEQISLSRDAVVIDATVGHGGHSLLFGERLGPEAAIFGLDVDRDCIRRAQENLSDLQCKVIIVRSNFSHIASAIAEAGIEKVDFILADLGFCSAQLTDSSRGLSFQENMPLDMRLDDRIKTTAADIVNRTDEKTLADLIYNFGQDRASRRIARFIAAYRRDLPITTTGQLAALVCRALNQPAKGRRSKIHPATRTFQALRIAVNDELGNIEKLLAAAPAILKKDGQIAVISFHSLEDRIVKNDFKQKRLEGLYEVITKKPLTASDSEIAANPRARSAKLRIAKRL
jgi:16S rRNA (cytosine1402-N4)-methyltransferase